MSGKSAVFMSGLNLVSALVVGFFQCGQGCFFFFWQVHAFQKLKNCYKETREAKCQAGPEWQFVISPVIKTQNITKAEHNNKEEAKTFKHDSILKTKLARWYSGKLEKCQPDLDFLITMTWDDSDYLDFFVSGCGLNR
jgi:hypothetical protein